MTGSAKQSSRANSELPDCLVAPLLAMADSYLGGNREGCAVQILGLATLALTVATIDVPSALLISLVLAIFGFGQGLVMAPLSSAVLATVKPHAAGSGSGMYGTTVQIANAAGVAVIGAMYFAVESAGSAQRAIFAALLIFAISIMTSVAFLSRMRRAMREH
jgi:hypothetical protein